MFMSRISWTCNCKVSVVLKPHTTPTHIRSSKANLDEYMPNESPTIHPTFKPATSPPLSREDLLCPQLPPLTPSQLAKGRVWNTPPLGWMCHPEKYYELAGVNPSAANCDCG
jgi:hypothetical protein